MRESFRGALAMFLCTAAGCGGGADAEFGLSASGNKEILAAWLGVAIERDYRAVRPTLEAFLLEVGRRKFLKPLYG